MVGGGFLFIRTTRFSFLVINKVIPHQRERKKYRSFKKCITRNEK